MSGQIVDFGIGLPTGWYVLPSGPGAPGWAQDTARGIAEGHDVPDETLETLATRLTAVKASVEATGVPGASTAVLVESPATAFVQAMLTMVLGRGMARETYQEQLSHVAEGLDDAKVMGTQAIEAVVPAGTVRGAHFLIGHLPHDEHVAGVHLEERVHLGVFPDRCSDMVDVTVIAASVGVFDDLAGAAVGLLEGLDVSTGAMA